VDAEFPLPFPDNYFDAVLCLDAFHYIRPKASLIRDVARVAKDDALWLFPHLHNALQRNPSAGIPLSPQDYSRCFRLASPRLFAERELLTGLTRSDALDLRQEPSAEALAASPALSVVGSRREGTWRLYERASGALIRASAPPVINPIYRVREEGDRLTLQMEWPDEQMRRECIMLEELLPLEVTLDRPFFTRVSRGEARPDDREKLQELVRTFVLVHLPKSWGQAPARPLAS
jgi:SAM-dependent methyltransferase